MDEVLYSKGIKIINDKLLKLKNGEDDTDITYKVDKKIEAQIEGDVDCFIKNLIKIIKDEKVERRQQIDGINELVRTIQLIDIKQGKVKFELNIDKVLYKKILGDMKESV